MALAASRVKPALPICGMAFATVRRCHIEALPLAFFWCNNGAPGAKPWPVSPGCCGHDSLPPGDAMAKNVNRVAWEWAFVAITAFWGWSFSAIHFALQSLSDAAFNTWRFAIAALCLLPVCLWRRTPLSRHGWVPPWVFCADAGAGGVIAQQDCADHRDGAGIRWRVWLHVGGGPLDAVQLVRRVADCAGHAADRVAVWPAPDGGLSMA